MAPAYLTGLSSAAGNCDRGDEQTDGGHRNRLEGKTDTRPLPEKDQLETAIIAMVRRHRMLLADTCR